MSNLKLLLPVLSNIDFGTSYSCRPSVRVFLVEEMVENEMMLI